MQFVVLRDETGAVQLTNRREVRPELDEQIDALTVGSPVAPTGRVVEAPQVKLGGIEVLVGSIEQVSTAEQPLPIAETSSPDLRLDWRFLDLRTPRRHLVFKGGHLFEQRMRSFLLDELGHQFVFVTDYPASVRPFYHLRPASDPTVTSSFDLIWNGLEVTTGAQWEHHYDVLVIQAAEQGIALEPIRHYVNCFRYGCPPHGGLGIGISRLLMKLLDLPSIRAATLLFRGPNRLAP